MRISTLALLTLLSPLAATAQLTFDPLSRSSGGVWLREGGDPWCAVSAPPLLHSVRRFSAGFAHFPSAWGLGPLTSSVAVAAVPVGPGAVGVSMSRFGSALYSETEAGVSWGSSSGPLLYGAAVRVRHLSIERYGAAWTPRVDLAAAVATEEWFLWGVRVTDVNRGAIGRSRERLRQGIALAATVHPRGLPGLLLQAGNDEGEGVSLRAAISFTVHPLAVMAGSSGSFTRIHAGLDCPVGTFAFGYGVVVHPVLGWSHAFWISAGVDR